MEAAGFVLAGGGSTRMGRDKALLPYRGRTLVEVIASAVQEAAGTAAIIGDPLRYAYAGCPVHADRIPGCGPIGGVFTALSVTAADWNLIVGCDMPMLSAATLRALVERAFCSTAVCVVAADAAGELHPLCAVYHRRSLPVVERAIRENRLKMRDLVVELETVRIPVAPAALANVNTPGQWLEFEQRQK